MNEKELELAIEVGTGILPGGKLTAKIRRTWQERATTFADQIAHDSGLSLEQVEEMVVADDRLADVFATASERVVRSGDTFYRAALGRLVSAALRGDVAIDRAEELIDQLAQLDATCIRLLAAVLRGMDERRPRASAPEEVARAAGFTDADADAAFARLAANGFSSAPSTSR